MTVKQKALWSVAVLYSLCVYGPMAAMSIGAALVFAVWLLADHGARNLLPFLRSQLVAPTLMLATACLWSLLWARFTDLTFFGMSPDIHWGRDLGKLWHLFFPFILAAVFSSLSEDELVFTVKTWFWAGVASAVFGVVQVFVPLYQPMPLPNAGLQGFYHATGLAGFHLSYASIMAFPAATCLSLAAILFRRERFSKRTQVASLCALVCFIAVIATFSKIAWIAIPLTVVFVAFAGLRGRSRKILVSVIVLFAIAFSFSPAVRSRFAGGWGPIRDRLYVWEANFEMVRQHPIFGVGWHHNSPLSEAFYRAKNVQEGFVSHAHNEFIDQLSSTGVVGLAALLWWCIVAALLAYRIYRGNHRLLWRVTGLGILGGWFCFHIQGITQSNFWDAKVLHQTGWMIALSLDLVRRTEKARQTSP